MSNDYEPEWVREWVKENELAESLGWIPKKDYNRDSSEETYWCSFQKFDERVWCCRKGLFRWVHTIFKDGEYKDHKYYKTLKGALTGDE